MWAVPKLKIPSNVYSIVMYIASICHSCEKKG